MSYIKRHIEQSLLKANKSFKALLVTGSRQVGKSTLLKEVFPDQNYITFDNPLLLSQAQNEPGMFFLNNRCPITLDEVQYIQELFPYIKIECDKSNEKGLFALTGSQSFQQIGRASWRERVFDI